MGRLQWERGKRERVDAGSLKEGPGENVEWAQQTWSAWLIGGKRNSKHMVGKYRFIWKVRVLQELLLGIKSSGDVLTWRLHTEGPLSLSLLLFWRWSDGCVIPFSDCLSRDRDFCSASNPSSCTAMVMMMMTLVMKSLVPNQWLLLEKLLFGHVWDVEQQEQDFDW